MSHTDMPDLPSISSPQPAQSPPQPKKRKKARAETQRTENVVLVRSLAELEVPLLFGIEGYTKRGVDCVFNTAEQRANFKAAYFGLQRTNAKMRDGSDVRSWSDTVRWVFEQMTPEESP